jgi:hypothetical protein
MTARHRPSIRCLRVQNRSVRRSRFASNTSILWHLGCGKTFCNRRCGWAPLNGSICGSRVAPSRVVIAFWWWWWWWWWWCVSTLNRLHFVLRQFSSGFDLSHHRSPTVKGTGKPQCCGDLFWDYSSATRSMSIYRNSLTNLSANLQMIFSQPSNEADCAARGYFGGRHPFARLSRCSVSSPVKISRERSHSRGGIDYP